MRHSGSKPKLSELKINNASRSCPNKQPKYAQTGRIVGRGSGMKFPLMFWQHAYAELFSFLTRTCRFSSQKADSFCSRAPHLCALTWESFYQCCHGCSSDWLQLFSHFVWHLQSQPLLEEKKRTKNNQKFHFKHKVFFHLSTCLCKHWQKICGQKII